MLPWNASVGRRDDTAISLELSTDLVRYPFHVERELVLLADDISLEISERITNRDGVKRGYAWQQRVALGPPFQGPAVRLDLPAASGRIAGYGGGFPNARLEGDETSDWPAAPGVEAEDVDLRPIPSEDATVHDLAFATDLEDGWYALTNPDLDLGFALQFPTDPFEAVWHWYPFGGYEESPCCGRNYNVGLEPTTAYPADADAQRENGTMKTLGPGENVRAEFTAATYVGKRSVTAVEPDGTVCGESP